MSRSTRSEAEVLSDLVNLARSPGYIHALARICYRDNFFSYQNNMRPEDIKKLYGRQRLIRTEMTTLLGLLVQGEIDKALSEPEVVALQVSTTDSLMEELHQAIAAPMWNSLKLPAQDTGLSEEITRGAMMREPIFYSGESAYKFQFRDLAPEKYSDDHDWLVAQRGFSIQQARTISEAMSNLLVDKISQVHAREKNGEDVADQWLPAYLQSPGEIAVRTGLPIYVVKNFFAAFTLTGENAQFKSVDDFNGLAATPLIPADEGQVFLFQGYSLFEAIYDSPFYWMLSDKAYNNTAAQHRGEFTERFAARRLEHVFGDSHVFRNVNFIKGKGDVVCEADVLVVYGDRIIILQAKSKKLTLEARRGNDGQIQQDFAAAIQDSYDQAYLCAETLLEGRCRLVDGLGKEVVLPYTPKEVLPFSVVSESYPALAFQSRQFLKYKETETIRAPFVMDVFLLDAMTEMLDTPLRLLNYASHRVENIGRLSHSHELTALSYHLKCNMVEPGFDFMLLDDDISADLELAMLVRRDGVPGPRTPEGILTRFTGTSIGTLLGQLESDPQPFCIELGVLLMRADEKTCRRVDSGLGAITTQARTDGGSHNFTISGRQGGITFHSNVDPSEDAQDRLGAYCEHRRYAQRANRWIGVSVDPDVNIQFAVFMDSQWSQSDDMDRATAGMQRPSRDEEVRGEIDDYSNRKVGRNELCPCGSGKKYKRCCL